MSPLLKLCRLFPALVLAMLVCACGNNNFEKIRVLEKEKDLPVERGVNVAINYTDSGYIKVRVYAPLLERYNNEEKSQAEMKKGITAYFYNRQKRISSYLKAKYAIRDERARMMTARNDVIVVNNKGDTLRTEELKWDEKTDKIFSDKFVRITTPDHIILGTGLESNPEFTRYRVFNITGVMSLKN
jgi:LPS export ABC transporter protein LptC